MDGGDRTITFDPKQHDAGSRTVLGTTADLDAEQLVDLLTTPCGPVGAGPRDPVGCGPVSRPTGVRPDPARPPRPAPTASVTASCGAPQWPQNTAPGEFRSRHRTQLSPGDDSPLIPLPRGPGWHTQNVTPCHSGSIVTAQEPTEIGRMATAAAPSGWLPHAVLAMLSTVTVPSRRLVTYACRPSGPTATLVGPRPIGTVAVICIVASLSTWIEFESTFAM
jgi:hypothetical protein